MMHPRYGVQVRNLRWTHSVADAVVIAARQCSTVWCIDVSFWRSLLGTAWGLRRRTQPSHDALYSRVTMVVQAAVVADL